MNKNEYYKTLSTFIRGYETKPNFIDAVRDIQGLNEWYKDLDDKFLTDEMIEAMADDYSQELYTEGRIHQNNNINYKE